MLWHLTYGDRLDQLQKAEMQGASVKALSDKPELMIGMQFYMTAYQDLLTERPIGLDAGRIPWSAIQQYGSMYGFDQDEIEVLESHLRAMEKAHRDFEEKKNPR